MVVVDGKSSRFCGGGWWRLAVWVVRVVVAGYDQGLKFVGFWAATDGKFDGNVGWR